MKICVKRFQRSVLTNEANIERTEFIDKYDTLDELVADLKKNYKKDDFKLIHSFMDEDKENAMLEFQLKGTSIKHLVIVFQLSDPDMLKKLKEEMEGEKYE